MTTIDIDNLGPDDREALASLFEKAAAIVRRAGGVSAATPIQLSLLPELGPIDAAPINFDERLPDGSRRWLSPKEVSWVLRLGDDAVIRRAREGAGIQIGGPGGRWRIDILRITGRA